MTFRRLAQALAVVLISVLISTASAQSATYNEVDVVDGGSISGKVTFEGELPADAVEQIAITKNPEVCGEGYREVVWVDVNDGALRGSFVFIDKIAEGKKWPQPDGGDYMIMQKDCRFTPWAQVIEPGPITIRNNDAEVLHNINTRELIGVEKGRVVKRTMFNFGQPEMGDIAQEVKPRRSPFIAINCEAHNFMFGFMMAPSHPYAAVVGEDGSFSLEGVPPGTYKVKAWHPRFGLKETEVTVPSNGEATAEFAFSN